MAPNADHYDKDAGIWSPESATADIHLYPVHFIRFHHDVGHQAKLREGDTKYC